MVPVFIFSLPRSGSTLIQRILSGHSEIATTAEPWVLLPLFYATRESGIVSEYNHHTSRRANVDFISQIGEDNYHKALNDFVCDLYSTFSNDGERYFLDKTPRYYLIIEEIVKVFPEAKFIFLFRNPLHVLSSIVSTFSAGQLNRLYPYDIDLKEGVNCLTSGAKLLEGKAHCLKYEDLVDEPSVCIQKLCEFLEIPYDKSLGDDVFGRVVNGAMGDPVKKNVQRKIDKSSLSKWSRNCEGVYRRRVVKKYMELLNEDDLSYQGYSKEAILQDVDSLPAGMKGCFNDFLGYNLGRLISFFKLNIFLGRSSKKWANKRYLG